MSALASGQNGPLVEMATGTGKAFTLCDMIKRACDVYSGTRVLQLVHTKELIKQNFDSMKKYWPQAPIGINSAGIGTRDYDSQIIFGGIQSLYNKAHLLGEFHIVLVDECHLIGRKSDSMYGQLLADLTARNPNLMLAGLTATPYRMQSGMLHKGEDALFSDIVYSYGIGRAVDDGYLVPPRTKSTDFKLELPKRIASWSDAKIEREVDTDEKTKAAVSETIAYAKANRLKHWIVFGSGVTHCEHIRDELRRQGVSAEAVTGSTSKGDRANIFAAHKSGAITALVNVSVATTGYDNPKIDLIANLRPTGSPGLWTQMVGRGSRLIDWRIGQLPTREERLAAIANSSKPHFHVLDFAGNTERHGPIDRISVQDTRGSGEGDAPIKVCPECHEIVYAGARECPTCEYEFPAPEPDIKRTASTEALLSRQREPKWLNVDKVEYFRHIKRSTGNQTLRVEYTCGLAKPYTEWIAIGTGYGNNWWYKREQGKAMPKTVLEALNRVDDLPKPDKIQVVKDGKRWKVIDYGF